jgi:hypothetical protein
MACCKFKTGFWSCGSCTWDRPIARSLPTRNSKNVDIYQCHVWDSKSLSPCRDGRRHWTPQHTTALVSYCLHMSVNPKELPSNAVYRGITKQVAFEKFHVVFVSPWNFRKELKIGHVRFLIFSMTQSFEAIESAQAPTRLFPGKQVF